MVGPNGLLRADLAIRDEAEHLDESELVLGLIDLPAEKRDARAVLLGVMNKSERIVGGARAASQNPHDQVGIVLRQFLHGTRAVIHYFEENGPPRLRHSRQAPHDVIIDELAQLFRRYAAVNVRVENLEKIAELFALGVLAKVFEGQERLPVLVQVVDKRHRIEAQVGAWKTVCATVALELSALDLVDRGGPEWLRGLRGIAAVAHRPNISGIIGASRRGDRGISKQTFLDRELLTHVSG